MLLGALTIVVVSTTLSLVHCDTAYYPHYGALFAAVPPLIAVLVTLATSLATLLSGHRSDVDDDRLLHDASVWQMETVNSAPHFKANPIQLQIANGVKLALRLQRAHVVVNVVSIVVNTAASITTAFGAHCELAEKPLGLCDQIRPTHCASFTGDTVKQSELSKHTSAAPALLHAADGDRGARWQPDGAGHSAARQRAAAHARQAGHRASTRRADAHTYVARARILRALEAGAILELCVIRAILFPLYVCYVFAAN